jgi:hypothetical protein
MVVQNKKYSNADGDDVCELVYEKKGATQFNNCKRAFSTGNQTLARAYAKALEGSFNGTFEEWKIQKGTSILSGLWGAFQAGKNESETVISEPIVVKEKNNTGLVIGVVVLAAIGIGAFVYMNKKG